MTTLGGDAILEGLHELALLASAAGIESTIFILGGSAVALIEGSKRRTTTDIDSDIRDTSDLPTLLASTGLLRRQEIDEGFAKYFPHDEISPKCQDWLEKNGYPTEAARDSPSWTAPTIDRSGSVYIETHLRNGKWIEGHWRKR